MYKVLIVDEARDTRERICESIGTDRYDIGEVRTAENAEEALTVAEAFLPDILIADIQISEISGIDLSQKIKKFNQDISVIFLCSYSEKEFLRSAPDVNIVKYVEKPVEPDELDSAVSFAVSRLREIENRLTRYGNDTALELTTEKTDYSIDRRDMFMYIGGAEFDSCFTVVVTSPDGVLFESMLYACAMMDKIRQNLNNLNYKFLSSYKDNNMIFHFFVNIASETKECAAEITEALYDCVKPCFIHPERLYLGCGSIVGDIGELHISYKHAVECSQKSFFFPNKHIFLHDGDTGVSDFNCKLIENFSVGLVGGDAEKTLKTVEQIKMQILEGSRMGKEKALDIFLKLFFEIEDVKMEINESESRIGSKLLTKSSAGIMNTMLNATSLDRLTDGLTETVRIFFDDACLK